MQVAKWGTSLAIRLPEALVAELGLREGDEVDVVGAADVRLAIAPIPKPVSAQDALARMAQRKWPLPGDYRFDRDEANARGNDGEGA